MPLFGRNSASGKSRRDDQILQGYAMETIAVYWEPKIRVYGLTTQTGLALYTLIFPVGRLAYWGKRIRGLEEDGRGFELVNLQTVSAETMQLCLLLPQNGQESAIRRGLENGLANEAATRLEVVTPVEVIYLHGPHFQDRYGIAEAAIAPLQKAAIPILAAGCSGTSVYLAVPGGRASAAAACLAETFVL